MPPSDWPESRHMTIYRRNRAEAVSGSMGEGRRSFE